MKFPKSGVTRSGIAVFAALILVVSTLIAVQAKSQPTARRAPVTQPTLVLTFNGAVVETFVAPAGIAINDVDVHWPTPRKCVNGIQWPPVLMQFTLNGTVVGVPQLAPCKANDFETAWDPNYQIIAKYPTGAPATGWTVNGKIIKVVPPPPSTSAAPGGANDFHLYNLKGGKIIAADWTFNGKTVFKIPLKSNVPVNDAHLLLP